MAHQRFRQQETVPENIKRIILEQLDRAADRLSSKTGSKDRSIHDARVCFKKVRAMLRLARFEIGENRFKEENVFYRDAGRELGLLRDTTVVADTLRKLVEDFADKYAATDLKWLRKRLMSSRIDLRADRKEVLQRLAKTVEASRERVKMFPLQLDSFLAIGPGLQRVYHKGRNCFEAVRSNPGSENLHEWRKQVKHLGYQIAVLNPIWPKMLEVHANELNKLSDFLSEDHDLVMLEARVLEQAESSSQIEDAEGLVAVIGMRREQLQRKAIALGARLYAEDPEGLVVRFKAYWDEWRPNSTTSSGEEPMLFPEWIQDKLQTPSIELSGTKASAASERGGQN